MKALSWLVLPAGSNPFYIGSSVHLPPIQKSYYVYLKNSIERKGCIDSKLSFA